MKDENGVPAMASFIIRDRLNRLYPLPSKRLAPDFFFQPQVYRADGESVRLPAGYYTIQYNGGPESLPHTREVEVNAAGPSELSFQLDRWIDPVQVGLVFGRPPRPRGRLLALHEPDRRRGASRHDAADSG